MARSISRSISRTFSRRHPAANAFSFIFLATVSALTPEIAPPFTIAAAMISPEILSAAWSAVSNSSR